jgi:hypothetical protein
MKDCKIRTYGIKELSEKIQARLFELGVTWLIDNTEIQHWKEYFLYVEGNMLSYSKENEKEHFEEKPLPEVTYQDLLDMQPEKPKTKWYRHQYLVELSENCFSYQDDITKYVWDNFKSMSRMLISTQEIETNETDITKIWQLL